MRTLIVINNTTSQLSYVSGAVLVPANSSLSILDTYKTQVALDASLRSDILAGNAVLSDGLINSYGLPYLDYFIPALSQDSISNNAQIQTLSVTTTPIAAIGGSTVLVGRKVLIICPTNGTIYWGISSSVTISTGIPIFQNQVVTLSFTDAISIYIVSAGTVSTIVFEGA